MGTGRQAQPVCPSVPSPSCHQPSYPQALTVPSPSSAKLWISPDAMAVTPLSPVTGRGVVEQGCGSLFVLHSSGPLKPPSPNWPHSLSPQASTVPFSNRARLQKSPADVAVTPVSPLTATGARRCSTVPSPSSPRP